MKKISRRHLIKGVGSLGLLTGLDSLGVFSKILRSSLMNSAIAQDASGTKKNLVTIALMGAPPRWTWDLCANKNARTNPGLFSIISTGFGGYNGFDYRTFDVGGVQYPELWKFTAPLSSGDRPIQDLIKNHLNIRGVDSGSDGHPDAAPTVLASRNGAYSIDGMLGSLSDRVLPSVLISAVTSEGGTEKFLRDAYKAPNGMGAKLISLRTSNTLHQNVETGTESPLLRLSGAFNNRDSNTPNVYGSSENLTSTFLSRRLAMTQFVDATLDAMKAEAVLKNLSTGNTYELLKKSQKTLNDGLSSSIAEFETKRLKYSKLIQDVFQRSKTNLPGITDFSEARNGSAFSNSFFNDEGKNSARLNNENKNYDLRQSLQMSEGSLRISFWAEAFATIETLLTQKLANSISVAINFPSVTGVYVGGNGLRIIHDAHNLGAIPHLVGYSLFYAVLSSCILELSVSLEASQKGLWNDTVVYVNGDFGRNPSPSQDSPAEGNGGSDHERKAQTASIFSGCINGPISVGNIDANSYGSGGTLTQVGSQKLQLIPIHVANTLATILDTEQPVRNAAESLVVKKSDGTVVLRPDVEKGKVA